MNGKSGNIHGKKVNKPYDFTGEIIEYEQDGLEEQDEVRLFQEAINSGMAWKMQGSYGRSAMAMIEAGLCCLGKQGHHNAYGGYVPSRFEVKEGTKGSVQFVEDHGNSVQED